MPISPDKLHLLDPVLKWLDAGAPHEGDTETGFNMCYFIGKEVADYAKNPCDTVCCIAGAVAQFNSLNPIYIPHDILGVRRVGKHLGLTDKETRVLFLPNENDHGLIEELTPEMAAKTLRHFIETGDVDWAKGGAPDYRVNDRDADDHWETVY